MTKNDIIRMAREAGFELDCCSLEWHERIARFAAFVAAAEREEWANEFAGLGEWTAVHILEDREAIIAKGNQ